MNLFRTCALLAIASLFGAPLSSASPSAHAGGIVSVTLDDGLTSQLEVGLPITEKFGIKGTAYIPSGLMNEVGDPFPNTHYMDWAGVRRFVKAGWEIGGHTLTHPNLTAIGYEDLRSQIRDDRKIIRRHTGVIPYSFASPFGEYNNDVLRFVRTYYKNHARAWGLEDRSATNDPKGLDHYEFSRYNVLRTDTKETLCSAVALAAKESTWLVFAFHTIGFDAGDDGTNQYAISKDAFEGAMKCVSDERDRGGITVLTVADALKNIPQKKTLENTATAE